MITTRKPYSIVLLLSTLCFSAIAQNQPPQTGKTKSVANIKVDGKPVDWNSSLRMHNSSTDVDYNISNDDENLYLMIQSKDGIINKKLFGGGITLTLNSTGKFGGLDFVSVRYPTISDRFQTMLSQLINEDVPEGSQQIKKKYADSILSLMNQTLVEGAKEIQVVGIKDINDVLISVYNEYGIKAALQFQDKKTLTYEIAIPLKYLAALTANNNKIFYNVKLSGISNTRNTVIHQTKDGPVTVTGVPHGLLGSSLSNSGYQTMAYATDFWSEYTIKQ